MNIEEIFNDLKDKAEFGISVRITSTDTYYLLTTRENWRGNSVISRFNSLEDLLKELYPEYISDSEELL